FVMFVITDEWFLDSEMLHQHSGMPRVFGCDQIDGFQDLQSAQCDVTQIADRRGDDIKHTKPSNQNSLYAIKCGSDPWAPDKARAWPQNESVPEAYDENNNLFGGPSTAGLVWVCRRTYNRDNDNNHTASHDSRPNP